MSPPNVTSGGMLNLSLDQLASFRGKVALVTGGCSGVGWEFVKILLGRDIKGILIADMGPLPKAEEATRPNVKYVRTDVSDWESIQKAFEGAVEAFGTLDIVYANAGIGDVDHLFVTIKNKDGKGLRAPNYKAMDVNAMGVMNTLKLAVHWFRELGKVKQSTNEPGRIVMTASTAGYETPGLPVYTASKHAVVGLMRSSALDLHDTFGIALNMVAPGPMITNLGNSFAARNTANGDQVGVASNGSGYEIPFQTPQAAALAAATLFQQPYDVFKCCVVSYCGKYKEVEDFYRKNSPLNSGEGNELGVPSDEHEGWRRLYDCTFDAPAA